MENKQKFQLEDAFVKLEETIQLLERDDLTLEQSFQEYQKGMDLLKKCSNAIDQVEKRVLVINENGETNEF